MRARAPGKIVLSGAYAVLEGAPGVVAAVDRYVVADTERTAERVTEEVRAALGDRSAPWFDASALREAGQKLGLGSSAAILVASLAALELEEDPTTPLDTLRARLFPRALDAHSRAQGGGSGIDVAASVHGGVLVAVRGAEGLRVRPVTLPLDTEVRVLSLGVPASTPALIGRVYALREREPTSFARHLGAQAEAAERAVLALERGDGAAWIAALAEQGRALHALGTAAGAAIVTPEVLELSRAAERVGAAALPAGAGGGDIAIWVQRSDAPRPRFDGSVSELPLGLGVAGVHSL